MCPNQIEVRQQFAVSMYDLHAYLKINKMSTRRDENTHANCLPTSLLDHEKVSRVKKGTVALKVFIGVA